MKFNKMIFKRNISSLLSFRELIESNTKKESKSITEILRWRKKLLKKNNIKSKLINIDKAVKEVTSLNSGLKGICRSTIMRILNLKVAPSHLK